MRTYLCQTVLDVARNSRDPLPDSTLSPWGCGVSDVPSLIIAPCRGGRRPGLYCLNFKRRQYIPEFQAGNLDTFSWRDKYETVV